MVNSWQSKSEPRWDLAFMTLQSKSERRSDLAIMLRDVAKLKNNPNIQITFGSGSVGPGLFWIENRILENHKKN